MNDWQTLRIGDITDWFSGGTPSKQKEEYWDGDIPWISAKTLKGTRVSDSELKITQLGLENGGRLAMKDDLLLLVRGSGLFNFIPISIVEIPLAFNQDIKAIRIKEEFNWISPWYLLFWFYSQKRLLNGIMEVTGIGAGKFDTGMLQDLMITIPPIDELKEITKTFKFIDEKIELLKAQNKTLETIAQTIFKEWFGKYQIGDELPKGWNVGKLKDLVEIKYGKDHKKLPDGEIPLYGSGGIMRYVDTALYNEESILIPRKGTLSNLYYLKEPFWSVDTMFYTIIKQRNQGRFCFLFLKSINLASMNVGSAVPSLTTQLLKQIPIIIPNDKIMEEFNSIIVSLYDKVEKNISQIQTLTKTRDTLLPKLMSGAIRVNQKQKAAT